MNKKAFTLIEIMITFVILGIMSSLVAPSFFAYQRQKDLDLSIQLIETTLEKSFSSSRSVPRIFGVSALQKASELEIFECEYPTCLQKKTSTLSLLPNIMITETFAIRFFPPHGDIDTLAFPDNTLDIRIQNHKRESRGLRIHKASGLIERLWSQ